MLLIEFTFTLNGCVTNLLSNLLNTYSTYFKKRPRINEPVEAEEMCYAYL